MLDTAVVAYTVFLLAAGFPRAAISANFPSSQSRPCSFEKLVSKTGREPRVGSEHDFDLIYSHGAKILRSKGVPSHDAEDILQNVMIRLMKSEAGYKGDAEYTSWISSVVSTAQTDFYRNARREKSLGVSLDATNDGGGSLAGTLTSKESAPERAVSNRDEASHSIPRVREAIRNLKSEFRMAYLLYAQGMSSQEMAHRLGVQSGTAKTRVFRAHAVLDATLSLGLDRSTAGLLKEGGWKPDVLPPDTVPRDAEQAMGLLAEHRRLILTWHEIFGLSLDDVARMLDRNPEDVARENHLAKKELDALTAKHGLEPASWQRQSTDDAIIIRDEVPSPAPMVMVSPPSTLEDAISKLSEPLQTIARASLLEEIGNEEIATRLGTNASSVAKQYKTAMAQLQIVLNENGITDSRVGHLYEKPPTNIVEAIGKVAPVHRKILRLRYVEDLEYSQIKSLAQYTGDANVSRKVKLAERALADVLTNSQLQSPNTMHLFGTPRTLEEAVRAIPGAPERAYLRLAVLEKLTHNEIIARLEITRMGAHTQRVKALEAFKQITTRYELPYRLELKGGHEKPKVWTRDEP